MIKAPCETCGHEVEFEDRKQKAEVIRTKQSYEYCNACGAAKRYFDFHYEWFLGVAKQAGKKAAQDHEYRRHYKESDPK